MGKLRFYIAMAAAKLSALALRILGRNASYMPGVIALKLCRDFIGYLKKPDTLICVTGTNGKTTTSNLLNTALTHSGFKVTNNSFGSNVQAGVAAALLLNSTFTGKHKNKVAVLEVDERSSLLVYKYITPDYLICNNIMRDSLKRNAHTEFISFIINSAVPAETKVFLNADDLNCATLAPQCKTRTYFGMDAERPEGVPEGQIRDVCYCPACGARLEPEYIRFNHIGRYHCTKCDNKSPERDYCVTAIDRENRTFTVTAEGGEHTLNMVNDNIVNIYNSCGAVSVLRAFGLTWEQIAAAFETGKVVETRYDTLEAGDLKVTLILTKGQNPIATSRVFSYVASCEGENKCVLNIFDDVEDNINNSESTCWLYDIDYSPLKDESIGQLIFAGPRCKDHLLRAMMTGIPKEKIVLYPTSPDSAPLVDTEKYHNVYILYDNYRLDEAVAMKKYFAEKGGVKA